MKMLSEKALFLGGEVNPLVILDPYHQEDFELLIST
jgi:hypothetical protein